MSNKSLLKFVVAFGLLALVLTFLGVNYVPRIYASSSAQRNGVVAGNQTRINYIDEQYQRAIAPQLSYVMSDWIERHPSTVKSGFRTPPMSNYFPSIAVGGFRTPPMSNYFPTIAVSGFRTPPMSNYFPSIAVSGFRTPPMSNYFPSIAVSGFRTPPMSNYIRPIGTERFFTPPPADYTP